MPWNETSPMDQRTLFVTDAQRELESVQDYDNTCENDL
jgi:hypothetical protein